MGWLTLLVAVALIWIGLRQVAKSRRKASGASAPARISQPNLADEKPPRDSVERPDVAISTVGGADSENLDDYDPSRYWFRTENVPRKIEARLTLNYESTSGAVTTRDVDVQAFFRGDGGCLLDCYCHLRKAKRTLSSKSVRRAEDRDTGEVIDDLCAFLESRYDHNPEKAYDSILQEFAWAIYILSYVAGSDGSIRAPERRLIAEFCQRRGSPSELDIEKLDAMVRSLGRPQKHDFHRYIRERTASPEVIRDIVHTANRIIATNSKAHTDQERAIAYMTKQWKAHLSG